MENEEKKNVTKKLSFKYIWSGKHKEFIKENPIRAKLAKEENLQKKILAKIEKECELKFPKIVRVYQIIFFSGAIVLCLALFILQKEVKISQDLFILFIFFCIVYYFQIKYGKKNDNSMIKLHKKISRIEAGYHKELSMNRMTFRWSFEINYNMNNFLACLCSNIHCLHGWVCFTGRSSSIKRDSHLQSVLKLKESGILDVKRVDIVFLDEEEIPDEFSDKTEIKKENRVINSKMQRDKCRASKILGQNNPFNKSKKVYVRNNHGEKEASETEE